MSKPDRDVALRLQAMGAKLSPTQIDQLVTDTTNRLSAAEIAEPLGRFVSDYLGFLSVRQHAVAEAATIVAGALPAGESPTVELGSLMFGAGVDLKCQYGDPFLSGTDSPLNPENLADAVNAMEARTLVERHLAEAYNAAFGSNS